MRDDDFATIGDQIERDSFFRRMLCELSGVLQDVVGEDETRGFVAVVGARIGDAFNQIYRNAKGDRRLTRPEAADAMVDLKARIGGGFSIESQSDEEIVLVNSQCPFGSAVEGRPALCMMTSNVFGRITAENLGYARVDVEEAFAMGHNRCRVRIALSQKNRDAAGGPGREYYRSNAGGRDGGAR